MDFNSKDNILIIVESPNKAKTIASILKKAGYNNITVAASVGHIMKLKNGGPAFNSGIYPAQNFKMDLTILDDKKRIVEDLKLKINAADLIYLMTDDDREGALIAWSIIKFCNIPSTNCFRVIAHEITPKSIFKALKNPIPFNSNLVDAGLARIMSDKLIGFGLSPLGKKYIGAKSIGRYQSIGLKLIADRENEILNFIPELYFNINLSFKKDNRIFKAKYIGYKEEQVKYFTRQADVDAILTDCKNSNFIISDIIKINHREMPPLPFCTATFQQEAVEKLGIHVQDAMKYAQKLFEGININGERTGLITYMRTDSTQISTDFLPELEAFVKNNYKEINYSCPKAIKKKLTVQDSHEALRVVDINLTPEKIAPYIKNNMLLKVYKLIWQRTLVSVISNAKSIEIQIIINNKGHKFLLSLSNIIFAGYKSIFNDINNQNIDASILFNVDEILDNAILKVDKNFTQPVARYTEASLVKELQQLEIGRPSTYVSIIETILSPTRGYAILDNNQIIPTNRGLQLADYCSRAFPSLININYIKEMENSLDKIATGKINLLDYMQIFYNNLKNVIDSNTEVGITTEQTEQVCPICGNPMVMRRSRFGKLFYGCSTYPKCNGIINLN